jgi:hypothetical protein
MRRLDVIKPISGITGTLFISKGVLNGRSSYSFFSLSHIAARFTDMNLMNVPKFVISATSPRSRSRLKPVVRIRVNATAIT